MATKSKTPAKADKPAKAPKAAVAPAAAPAPVAPVIDGAGPFVPEVLGVGAGSPDYVEPEPDPVLTKTSVHRLELARALPLLAPGEKATQVTEGIRSFKDEDRTTMNVVIAGDQLHKQEVTS